jgi:hypothetical protein
VLKIGFGIKALMMHECFKACARLFKVILQSLRYVRRSILNNTLICFFEVFDLDHGFFQDQDHVF